jgi:demethylmenaquinone methyltransferase/2-methoxy-6-polyprenyl-1,4-benzoquinol methylase
MSGKGKNNEAERIAAVRGIFSSIPRWYDFLNRFLSLRRDVAWRRYTVGRMRFFSTNAFLDVATGTGDLAIEAATKNPSIQVTGLDFVGGMLDVGRVKIRERGLEGRIRLIEGDAMSLPFEDASFDVAAIAFGIRNIPDRVGALREMARVVAPGGSVMVLELTTPAKGPFKTLYGLYLNGLLPLLGRVFSGDARAYRYLADSIMEFPTPEKFSAIMREAGLKDVEAVPLTFGIARLHLGRVP